MTEPTKTTPLWYWVITVLFVVLFPPAGLALIISEASRHE